jgi:ParB family chromosome partitioning protein
MPRKTCLGRGLDALIPGRDETPPTGGIHQIPVNQINRNPRQPRTHFDPDELAELAASIREHGIIQPLIVTSNEENEQYTLVAGERRLEAARQAGMHRVPAIIREASEQQRLELALIENVQRADLNPLESAEAYRQLAEDFGLSHEEISSRVGKSRTAITNTLRLLKLPQGVQQALIDGAISEGHARALLTLTTPQAQAAALQTILSHGLNVRQTEDLVRKLAGQKTPAALKPPPPPEVSALEERLRTHLGTKVSLNRRRKGGTLVIHFYSDEELDNLVEQILGDSESRSGL